jgi:serine/threonine protein kinase
LLICFFFVFRLKDEKSAVKTLWPVACREFLFLPEFKIRHEGLENSYEVISYIAKGSFGTVYKVRKSDDKQIFAVKVLDKSKVNSNQNTTVDLFFLSVNFPQIIIDDCVQQLKYEVLIQKAISHHPFIATSYERWQNKGCIYQRK